jgi:hypothetical protein
MHIFNRAHVPWFIFVVAATVFATWLYMGNFAPENLPAGLRLPQQFAQKPSEHQSVGGTPLGLIFGAISLSIFVFAALLGARKKVVLWRIGNVQSWLRAHIWLTLLTIPLVLLHSGFRLGGEMTTLLMILYAVVMISGIYGLVLQDKLPRIMKERLPVEAVYEQIPHRRAQLYAAATKMRDSFKPTAPGIIDASATAVSTPAAEAVAAEHALPSMSPATVSAPVVKMGTLGGPVPCGKEPAATTPKPSPVSSSRARKPEATAADAADEASEAALVEFLEQQILPYLAARRGDKFRLGSSRYSEDLFHFVKLRVAETYHSRAEEIQAWCDERRMLDLQTKLQHWLHGWLFVHVPISFLLIMLAAWHAFVTLFYY